MAYTPAHLKKVFDSLRGHKTADIGVILGVLGGRGGGGVIEGYSQPLRVFHLLDAQAVKSFDDSSGIVVTQGDIRGYVEHLAWRYLRQPGIFGENFFNKRVTHWVKDEG
jgi:hypothetical protein